MAAGLEAERLIRLQLRTRYALALLILLLATVGSLSAALLTEFSVTADDLRKASAKSMDVGLLRQYERRAYLLQVDTIAAVADGLTERTDINAIVVFDSGGLLYYSGSVPGVDEEVLGSYHLSSGVLGKAETFVEYHDQSIASSAPIMLTGKVIGHVLVNLSLAPIQEQIALARDEQNRLVGQGLTVGLWASLGITLTFGGLGIVLAVFMGGRLSRPIETLAKLARQIGQGDYDIPADIKGSGEIRDLVQSFHTMANDLRNTTVSKTHLDNILHGMLDGLVVVDADGRIRTANRATCKLLGHKESELLGQPVSSFFSPPAAMLGSEISNRPHESIAHRKNGDGLPVLLSVSALRERSADGASNVWVFRDITRLKATQNALVAAVRESERANHAKSQFLANMSHELRTPLNAIIGYSEMLVDDARDSGLEKLTDDLNRIHTAGRHLLGLIDDVLDLSKIEAGKMDLKNEEFRLQTVIEDVTATVRPLVDERGNSLTVDCPAQLAPMCSDQMKVRQILSNILSNAAKFTRNGSIAVTVRPTVKDDGDWITIRIADTGIGMTAIQLENVFGEFIQADSSTTREYGGTGLGLAISRQMVHMLGGEISAASTPDEGSVFSIRLPASLASPAVMAPEQPEQVSAATPERPRVALGRVLLAIINDPGELARIAQCLIDQGFRVVSTSHGQEGLRLARDLKPFAILLDTATPEPNGRTVTEQLDADPNTCGIPVIAMPFPSGEPIDEGDLFDRLASLITSAATSAAPAADEDSLAYRHQTDRTG
jgi:PAS domain S-box-containing protein